MFQVLNLHCVSSSAFGIYSNTVSNGVTDREHLFTI
jgi:hypothetical protein